MSRSDTPAAVRPNDGLGHAAPKRCEPCRATGAVHCSDPENCGGPWDKMHDAAPLLERWGRGPEGTPYLLQRRHDGYWTPWHIAEQTLADAAANRDRAVRLLHLAMAQLRRWGDAYGTHTPPWLPPAGDVRLAEDVDEFTAGLAGPNSLIP